MTAAVGRGKIPGQMLMEKNRLGIIWERGSRSPPPCSSHCDKLCFLSLGRSKDLHAFEEAKAEDAADGIPTKSLAQTFQTAHLLFEASQQFGVLE